MPRTVRHFLFASLIACLKAVVNRLATASMSPTLLHHFNESAE